MFHTCWYIFMHPNGKMKYPLNTLILSFLCQKLVLVINWGIVLIYYPMTFWPKMAARLDLGSCVRLESVNPFIQLVFFSVSWTTYFFSQYNVTQTVTCFCINCDNERILRITTYSLIDVQSVIINTYAIYIFIQAIPRFSKKKKKSLFISRFSSQFTVNTPKAISLHWIKLHDQLITTQLISTKQL